MENTSTVKYIPFGLDIIELHIHENCGVVPVNILAPFAHPIFLGNTTHYRVS